MVCVPAYNHNSEWVSLIWKLQEFSFGGVQVWVGRQIGTDPNGPTWQELSRIHRSSSAAPSDQDELGGSRILRPRQRVTLTTVLHLPSGEDPSLFTL